MSTLHRRRGKRPAEHAGAACPPPLGDTAAQVCETPPAGPGFYHAAYRLGRPDLGLVAAGRLADLGRMDGTTGELISEPVLAGPTVP